MEYYSSDYYDNILNRSTTDNCDSKNAWPAYSEYGFINFKLSLPDELNYDDVKTCLRQLSSILDEELNFFIHNKNANRIFKNKVEIFTLMKRIAGYITDDASHSVVLERIDFLLHDFDKNTYPGNETESNFIFLCGFISTWFGKDTGQWPSAIFAKKNGVLHDKVKQLIGNEHDIIKYFKQLHAGFSLNQIPDFVPVLPFFVAGEANGHPKHIAYFLPEDEGIKKSSNKVSYYLSNVHEATFIGISQQLYNTLSIRPLPIKEILEFDIPLAGVLAHELGHSITRHETNYQVFNKHDRWMSVTYQEICADVFGILIVCELWPERLGCTPEHVIDYYLAECLRYAHRGVGYFPDSDGMLFQLSWLMHCGALNLKQENSKIIFDYQSDMVISSLRALARVLADSFLKQDISLATKLYKIHSLLYSKTMLPLMKSLSGIKPFSMNYIY